MKTSKTSFFRAYVFSLDSSKTESPRARGRADAGNWKKINYFFFQFPASSRALGLGLGLLGLGLDDENDHHHEMLETGKK